MAIAELQFVSTYAAYLPGTNNMGVVVVGDGTAVAIDTGIDKESGRMLRRACEAAKLQLVAVISTHHHADHVGGNDYLVRNVPQLTVYAPAREAPFIEDPYLEPSYLSLGATPIAPLRNRFVMATPAPVHQRIDADTLCIGQREFCVVAVPGHSLAQIAVLCDGVCFAADSFFGDAVLAKYGMPYAHDVNAQCASFDAIARVDAGAWIPGHGELTTPDMLSATLARNQQIVRHSKDVVVQACHTPQPLQAVVASVQRVLGVQSSALAQYAVFASGISAYLAALHADGRVTVTLSEHGPLWQAVV
jgi:glyoxylase-like metal-dependent hydrolase (beta-lactamase superfamily II)